jgi:peptidoglycan/LPS O-acetylase OafA/YrhL
MTHKATRQRQKYLYPNNDVYPYGYTGFTLTELTVYIALLVIVLGIAYTLFFFINKSFDKGGDQFQLQTNIRVRPTFKNKKKREARMENGQTYYTLEAERLCCGKR